MRVRGVCREFSLIATKRALPRSDVLKNSIWIATSLVATLPAGWVCTINLVSLTPTMLRGQCQS